MHAVVFTTDKSRVVKRCEQTPTLSAHATAAGSSTSKHRFRSLRMSSLSCSSSAHTLGRFHGLAGSVSPAASPSGPSAARRSSALASHSCSNSISSASSGPREAGAAAGAGLSAAPAPPFAVEGRRWCAAELGREDGSNGDAGEMGDGFCEAEDEAGREAARGRLKRVEGTGRTQRRSFRRLCCGGDRLALCTRVKVWQARTRSRSSSIRRNMSLREKLAKADESEESACSLWHTQR